MASSSNTTKKRTTSRTNAKSKTASGGTSKRGTSAGKTAKDKTANSSRKKVNTAAVSAKRQEEQMILQEQEKANPMIFKEAALWLLLAVCILIFISYLGIGGYVGTIISDLSFGVFGIAAYAFPILLFVAAAFLISNRGSRIAGLKFASSVGLYLCICSFAALLSPDSEPAGSLMDYYRMSAARKNGGGLVGGGICSLLRPAVGAVGAGIILLILSIVFLLLITQKSLMRGMKNQSTKVYHSAKESGARRREAHRQERARREEWVLQEQNAKEQEAVPVEVSDAQLLHQPEPVKAKYSQTRKGKLSRAERKEQLRPVRTQIEVPVLFPVESRESRAARRVTGVTMDTKLEAEPQQRTGAEIHEILPRRTGKAAAPMMDAPEKETAYIDLDQMTSTPEKMEKAENAENPRKAGSELEIYQEDTGFQIEGIEETPQEHPWPEEIWPVEEEIQPGEQLQEDSVQELSDSDRSLASDVFSSRTRKKSEIQSSDSSMAPGRSAGGGRPAAGQMDGDESEAQQETGGAAAAERTKKNPRSSQQEIEEGIASVEAEMEKAAQAVRPEYVFPPMDLLKKGKGRATGGQEQEIRKTAAKLQQTLESFGVRVTVTNVSCGPSVTRYELLPEQGVKVSRIVALSDDIKLNLAAADIRIEAPIPGKAAVGIEVPNAENSAVALRDLLESEEFQKHESKLAFATGKDIGGRVVVADIAKMPHLLIAGATGSGKSVCINTIIMSILYKANPDEVKLIMIDPKVVELSVYNGIPHLYIPVVTDPKKAAGALNWGVAEMTDRYNKFAEYGVRDLKGYNKKVEALKDIEDENKPKKLPQIVIIVDELADLMMVAPGEVEDSICRLAQLARAAGIHLIIATQRPSVNVITGLIKANMPSRIAFSVSSSVDSRTIIDMGGAEKLLGKGDMLFYPQGYQKPARVQGAYVSDEEVSDVVDFLKNKNMDASYNDEIEAQIAKVQQASTAARGSEDSDALFADAGKFIIEKDKASIGMLQRVFKIGFNRAARIMDQLSEAGVVGPEEGTKPRKILMSAEQFENYLEEN